MISDILAVYKLISEEIDSASLLTALFSSDGNKKEGNENINIKTHGTPGKDKVWFYEVLSFEDYIFVPFPVNPGVHTDYGKANNELNSDVKFFRYVASPMAKFTKDGEENVKVDFMVFGYKPKDLLERKKRNH